MTKYTVILLVVLTLFIASAHTALSDVPDSQKAEVEHLLEFVETTKCIFERNGKKYNGIDAAKHIKRKYKYFKNQITSTEEFIEYSGTKSTVSGKPYMVYCGDGEPIESKTWLIEELALYRNSGA